MSNLTDHERRLPEGLQYFVMISSTDSAEFATKVCNHQEMGYKRCGEPTIIVVPVHDRIGPINIVEHKVWFFQAMARTFTKRH